MHPSVSPMLDYSGGSFKDNSKNLKCTKMTAAVVVNLAEDNVWQKSYVDKSSLDIHYTKGSFVTYSLIEVMNKTMRFITPKLNTNIPTLPYNLLCRLKTISNLHNICIHLLLHPNIFSFFLKPSLSRSPNTFRWTSTDR